MPSSLNDDLYVASVGDLIRNFQSALVALVPAAERAGMIWADVMSQHDEWEKLQWCLFDAFVAQPVRVDLDRIDGEYPLARYDIDLEDYSRVSRIIFRTASGDEFSFVRLVTQESPFDTVQGVEVDVATRSKGRGMEMPLDSAQFFYLRCTSEGRADQVSTIRAVE